MDKQEPDTWQEAWKVFWPWWKTMVTKHDLSSQRYTHGLRGMFKRPWTANREPFDNLDVVELGIEDYKGMASLRHMRAGWVLQMREEGISNMEVLYERGVAQKQKRGGWTGKTTSEELAEAIRRRDEARAGGDDDKELVV